MTWLPYANMRLSAHVLDASTLGVQLGQTITILRIIAHKNCGGQLRYHSTTLSWMEHPGALVLYADCIYREIAARGYDLEDVPPSPRSADGLSLYDIPSEWCARDPTVPDWLGIERIHASHRASLLNKDLAWYSQYAWLESPAHRMEWPGKMPRVGDYVSGPDKEIGIVSEFDSQGKIIILIDGKLIPLERSKFRSGQWRRCVLKAEGELK